MAASDQIERSPADVLRLGVAGVVLLVLLALELLFGDTLVAFASDLLRGLDAVPEWIADIVLIGSRILACVLVAGGVVWAVASRQWRLLGTTAVAGAVAAVLAVVVRGLVDHAPGPSVIDVAGGFGPLSERGFPGPAGLGLVIAMLTAVAPWASRRWRRAAWVVGVALVLARLVAAPVSFDAVEAAVLGWLVGAAVLVALGAPSRRPSVDAVVDGLNGVGLPVAGLEQAGVDARGSTPYFGETTAGERVFVKALGDDERSADVMFRLYRRLTPRDYGDEKPFGTLRRAVEHEALVALAARDLGVATPRLRAFTTAEPNGFVLAYDAIEGRSLDRLDELTDDVLAGCWRLLGRLREHRIAHRDLRLANLFGADDGSVWLIDFGFSELAASDLQLATDVAELVASSGVAVGAERAVAHAAANVDRATLSGAVDRLRPWSLSGATRTGLKQRPGLLDELRRRLDDASSTTSS